jgi:thioredoxin-like negative regulator of GroEL
VVAKAQALATSQVAVVNVEYPEHKDLHDRYGIDAVPTVVVADADGVVRGSFIGPVSATDLWAGVAEIRQPGSRAVSDCATSPVVEGD